MKRYRLLVIFLTITSTIAYGQTTMQKAIAKAWPASVRMWGYDTATKQQMSAQFSAVVVSAEGDILTAAHTSTPGKTYRVMFPDGKEAIALALGKIEMADDPTIPDVSMMKIITPGTWPYAEMGYSSSLQLNQPCISIAYPESLNQALPGVRLGIITSLGNERGFLQSTCAMEPGDSGGPLFDELGRVIGIHSAISVEESLNYEIPVDLFRKYRTALATAKKYNAFPANADNVGKDPLQMRVNTPPAFSTAKNACLLITSQVKDKQENIYGTVISPFYVISKSSMVGSEPVIHINNKTFKAAIIRRDREKDLVLLKMDAPVKDGISLAKVKPDSISFKQLGQFLVSPRLDTANAVSIVSTLPFSLPKINSTGFLGASIAQKSGPLLLTFVRKNSPAAANDLKVGDEVISINNVTLHKAENFTAALQQSWPGDTITISLKREGSIYTKQVVLDEKPKIPATHPAEMFAGGKSSRRDGFERVFAHDAFLAPNQCGGPVFDAAGNFMGINIARYSRTSTLAIPSEIIREFMQELAF
ncbi:trypsin-like peptidase domain-containing protein [Chitinophaga niabensis]|uniref:Serine protease Do n=1 Tax=Chitinophaga niabensis TaxID=536979 RepID=A0A1N6EEP1_9BACT|nr:trypsin-like peptidase domain-containing protein [Chitinophaga niabensis]SIN81367.1 serine protease Do [Chitinophaga niabensis]